ncbi:MAG: lipoprotein-releasing ABC transporter permease subunit [Alphaproteobacteria bacterium]|nr:lipoprotein-releasing ABC transporter permease subunit [Alphaproteobacteria bacterium]MBO4644542.1 lipoprotein-releasing ABC transporter permease subunit [Alphaproteobacteria bacterium]
MIFSAFERMVAFRYLRARRKEGFVSVIAAFSFLGIVLGVATLIIVMAVMNGFRQELLSRVLGLNGHIGIYSIQGAVLSDYDELAEKARKLDGVKMVMPLIEGQVMVSSVRSAQGAIVRGIRPEDFMKRKILSENLIDGSPQAFFEPDTVFIGDRLAHKLGIYVGEEITLISPKGTVTAFGSVPRMRSYTVGGTFEVGMYEYDSAFIFMPMADAQKFFNMDETVTNLEVFLERHDLVPSVQKQISSQLGAGLRVYDWQRSNAAFFNAIQVERNVMFLILTLIILVASFNMISGLIMLVKDKGRDIAVLRTMGATRGMVMRIFFMSGASIGFFGTLFGVIFGLLFCDNIENIRRFLESLTGTDLFSAEIYFLSRLPAEVDPVEVVAVVIMALFLSFAATIYPSWRAARLDPVEALRYE